MSKSPRLHIPYITESQAQKEVTHNEMVTKIDLLVQTAVLGIINDPPPTPAEGDCYIIGNIPTGTWTSKENHLTEFVGTAWITVPPLVGWRLHNQADGKTYCYHDEAWNIFEGEIGPQGQQGATGQIGLIWHGAWNISTNYVQQDAVSYGGSAWIAIQNNTGMQPTEGAYWDALVQKGADGSTAIIPEREVQLSAGVAVTPGILLCLQGDGTYRLADNAGIETACDIVYAKIAESSNATVVERGTISITDTLIPGKAVYLGETGKITQTAPTATGKIVKCIGWALGTHSLYLNPDTISIKLV